MKKYDFSEVPTEQLIKNKKISQRLTFMLIAVLTLLFGIGFYIAVTDKFTPLLAVPFALSTIVIINLKNVQMMRKELEKRKNRDLQQ